MVGLGAVVAALVLALAAPASAEVLREQSSERYPVAPGAVVSEIARRHGLTPQQLFGWRRAARRSTEVSDHVGSPRFVPAVVEEPKPKPVRKRRKPRRASRSGDAPGIIEMEIGGVTVRVGRGAEVKTVAAVIHALKASP